MADFRIRFCILLILSKCMDVNLSNEKYCNLLPGRLPKNMWACMCVGFVKLQNFDRIDDKKYFQLPFFGRIWMENQQINSNKSGKRRFYTSKMNQYHTILLLSSPINLRHEFYVCVQKFPATERNVARNFLLHVFYHSNQIWHRLSTLCFFSSPSRMMMCYVNQLTSFGQTIRLDFCFVDRHFSYFFLVLFRFVFVGSFNDLKIKRLEIHRSAKNRT